MTSSTADGDSYRFDLRQPHPNVDLNTLRGGLVESLDDLAQTVALLAEAQAGVADGYFLTDVLFSMVGELMASVAELTARLDNPPPTDPGA